MNEKAFMAVVGQGVMLSSAHAFLCAGWPLTGNFLLDHLSALYNTIGQLTFRRTQ